MSRARYSSDESGSSRATMVYTLRLSFESRAQLQHLLCDHRRVWHHAIVFQDQLLDRGRLLVSVASDIICGTNNKTWSALYEANAFDVWYMHKMQKQHATKIYDGLRFSHQCISHGKRIDANSDTLRAQHSVAVACRCKRSTLRATLNI